MVGGAIDEHLLFIFATWSGLTGNKCVQEVNKAGECVKKKCVTGVRGCPSLLPGVKLPRRMNSQR